MTRLSIFATRVAPLCVLLQLLSFSYLHAQITLTGTVVDQATGQPLPGAEVFVPGARTASDGEGDFELVFVPGGGQVVVIITKEGYLTYEQSLSLSLTGARNLGAVRLTRSEGFEEVAGEDFIPTIVLGDDDPGGGGGGQSVSGVLTASRDAFVSAAAFVFGQARFRIRGYDNSNTSIFLNGAPVNDLEAGNVFWSDWAGLNDVTRNRSITLGLDPVNYAFGGLGGASNIDLRASSQRKQFRVSYSQANITYNQRLMATYSTGRLQSGWAFSVSASRRWAQEAYIPGTFFDGYGYYLGVDKQLGRNHLVSFTAFGTPTKRGRANASVQEMNDLAGTNYYNPNWGFQNGEKRNSRVANIHQPVMILRHDWKLSDATNLMTSVSFQTGRDGDTALDWYNAPDPRPDYYRKLPSYIENEQSAVVENLLRTDESARQINWDRLYDINRNSFATIENANGIEGNTVSGKRAQYVVEDRRNDRQNATFNAVIESFVSDRFSVHGGLMAQQQKVYNFKVLDDLLGGDFYLDIDKFAEFDSAANTQFIQNDVNTPNRILREGDRFGWDYDYTTQQGNAWLQADLSLSRVDLFVAGQVSSTRFWRTGNVANGKFLDASVGDSEVSSFLNGGLKGGLTFKIDGRHYLIAHGAYLSRAPFARDAFVSPRTRNQLVDGLGSETMYSFEGGYLLRAPSLKARAIGYFTRFDNQLINRSFFLDNALRTADGVRGGFVNYIISGVSTEHLGLELALEAKVSSSLTATAVAALGRYTFVNRPRAVSYLDNVANQLRDDTIYMKNFYVPGTPQTAYTLGLSYNSRRFWFASINFNFFDNMYLDFYPARRTNAAVSYVENPTAQQDVVDPNSTLWRQIIDQEKAPSAFTVNLFGGKSWKIDDVFLYLNIGINNLLNKQDFITGGFEQYRFDFETKDVDRFPSRYFYSFGRTYFVNLALRM